MVAALQTIDTASFLKAKEAGEPLSQNAELCQEVANILKETGILIVRDPRVNTADNDVFLDMMENYFAQEEAIKLEDARPNWGYQVGVTPENTEVPRCSSDQKCLKFIDELGHEHKPHAADKADPKWRFFWKMGTRPPQTKFPDLNADPVIPKHFPEWETVMNRWGTLMMEVSTTVAEMAAIGLGLEGSEFTSRVKYGPHLLAPTGSNLAKYSGKGTVFAGFHYDLNFLTIHGKSRYPGLYVWDRKGNRIPVKVPEGCLLVQAGKQIEWLTGGAIKAGYHEVVVDEGTLQAAERAREKGRPLWRISSTLFLHIASDELLQPLGHFATDEALKDYPPTFAGDYVQQELETIKLKA